MSRPPKRTPGSPRYQPGARVYVMRYVRKYGEVLLCERFRALVRLDGASDDESIALSDLYPAPADEPATAPKETKR